MVRFNIQIRRDSLVFTALILLNILSRSLLTSGQLPDDIQRELNQNLAEQARIQAMRQQHQNQIKNRQQAQSQSQAPAQPHDPNNYSYQQVSPPIQYSYYQPFGDAAQQQATSGNQPQQASANSRSSTQPNSFDFNNLNFDLPQPQAQVSSNQPASQQPVLTPSFVGAGGLPVMRPIAGSAAPPLAPQAQVQQGPPLSEADFRDITGGENYGAPGGQDFGLGSGSGGNGGSTRGQDNTDAQLREFGFPGDESGASQASQRPAAQQQMNVPDFGAFDPIGASGGGQRRSNGPNIGGDDFGGFDAMSGPSSTSSTGSRPGAGDFDFGVQPSQSENRGDQMNPMGQTNAPGSLQSLLGAGFPGLGSGEAASGMDDGFAAGLNEPAARQQQQTQRSSPESSPMDIADLGEKSDQFSGADLGGFGDQSQNPTPRNEQDFNFASSNEQPSSVPYPDTAPQPVGSLLALTQPQSLTQTRYSALPDKGSYQDYPAYAQGGSQDTLFGFGSSVSEVVERTPAPRSSLPGRYGRPSFEQLAPEYRTLASRHYDYSRGPREW